MARSQRIYLVWVGYNDEPDAVFTVKREALAYARSQRAILRKDLPMAVRVMPDGRHSWSKDIPRDEWDPK